MASEKAIQKGIIRALNSMACTKAIKLHGSAFQEAGTPDILCVSFAMVFMFEVKKINGVVSEIQKVRISEWNEAGVKCLVCFSAVEVIEYVLGEMGTAELIILEEERERLLEPIVLRTLLNLRGIK